jgi:cell division cycle protein 37
MLCAFFACLQMETATKRMEILQYELSKLDKEQASRKGKAGDDSDDDDDDDDDLEERRQALQAELTDLENQNAARRAKIAEYEKNKKFNVDNMFVEKESRTFISPTAGTTTFTSTGYVKSKEELEAAAQKSASSADKGTKGSTSDAKKPASSSATTKPPAASGASSSAETMKTKQKPQSSLVVSPAPPPVELGAMQTYHEFTERYADTVELFMTIPDLEGSKAFLLRYADIMLQENASNYLLLASLEDEMNGHREKMKLTARQSQIITSIAELAKTLKTHPGIVIEPFFGRLQQREHLEEFVKGVKDFQEKIIERAVVKKREMDAARDAEADEDEGSRRELAEIPLEERLGPGGLDPLEVIETLPAEMVAAFESRDVEELKAALARLPPDEAEYHMKRCVDSGLWVANA